MNPTNTIFAAKRLIGRAFTDPAVTSDRKQWPFEVVNVDSKPKVQVEYKGATRQFWPAELSSMVLAKMKETAEKYLGSTVTDAVVTVPANFNDAQRRATITAGGIAGLNILRVINEPTAAAIAYGWQRATPDETPFDPLGDETCVLVFDLGGGSFDVSIVCIDDGICEVKATAGNTSLGGEDFDNRLVNHFMTEFKHDLSGNPKSLQRLRKACEQVKLNLSSDTQTTLEIDSLYEGIDFCASITRATFEELCSDLFRGTLEPVKKCLRDAKLEKSQIDEIVLVGGSTRIPKIQQLLQAFFNGKALNKSINPDEAVAYGAAVQAAILTDYTSEVLNLQTLQDFLLMDVASHSLGIDNGSGVMTTVIKQGTTVPTKQTTDIAKLVEIKVYEGDHTMVNDNTLIGVLTFDLDTTPPSTWDQRGAPEETWKAILEGAPSGTFVVRTSNSAGSTGAAGEVVATISMVKQDGADHFNQRIVRTTGDGGSESFRLKGSRHVHASLSALVAFYKDPMYFAQPGKPDVPAVLVEPTPVWSAGDRHQLEVTFDIDGCAVLNVNVRDRATGESKKMTITNDRNTFSQADIDEMEETAVSFRREDVYRAKCIDARDKLEANAYNVKRIVEEAKEMDFISEPDMERALIKVHGTLAWLDANLHSEKEDYEYYNAGLDVICKPIVTPILTLIQEAKLAAVSPKKVTKAEKHAAAVAHAVPALSGWTLNYSDKDGKVFYNRAKHPKSTVWTYQEMERIVKKEAEERLRFLAGGSPIYDVKDTPTIGLADALAAARVRLFIAWLLFATTTNFLSIILLARLPFTSLFMTCMRVV